MRGRPVSPRSASNVSKSVQPFTLITTRSSAVGTYSPGGMSDPGVETITAMLAPDAAWRVPAQVAAVADRPVRECPDTGPCPFCAVVIGPGPIHSEDQDI